MAPHTTHQYANTTIYVGHTLHLLPSLLAPYTHTIILIDANVHHHWGHLFSTHPTIIVPSGEATKNIHTIATIIDQLIDLGANRNSFLLGVGGGVVGDITGYVAAIFMRGIPFALIPTTLLAQVDASIGGKNGVNTTKYKNMMGTIYQPTFVLADQIFLSTLPNLEFVNGLAEVVKHACICSADYFDTIESQVPKILAKEPDTLYPIINTSIAIKTQIVAKDPYEKNERKHLNYGHTIGHAIEKVYNLPHGQAVSLGIIKINQLALQKQHMTTKDAQKIQELLHNLGLPTNTTFIQNQLLIDAITKDKKKNTTTTIQTILLSTIGTSHIVPTSIAAFHTI